MSVGSEERESNRELIDDAENDESVENHCAFDNVSRDYDDPINDSLSGFDFSWEAANYCSDNETEEVVDNFRDYKKKVDDFKKTLVNLRGDNNSDLFFVFFFNNFICNLFSTNWKNKHLCEWRRVKKWY